MQMTSRPSTSPEPVAAHPDLKKRFFELVDVPQIPIIEVVAVLLTGYPSAKQVYELEEKNHLGLSRLMITCVPDGQPSDLALIRVRSPVPLSIDPDGMSGGFSSSSS